MTGRLPDRPVVLPAGTVVLREYRRHDLEALIAMAADAEIRRWNFLPDSETGARQWMRSCNDWSSGSHASWAVADEQDGLVGTVSLHHLDLAGGDSQIGYRVAPACRGRGIGRLATEAGLRYGFDLGLHRIECFHAVDNQPSCRLALAVGMRLEGLKRESYVYGDGRRHDEHVHARLATD